MDSEQTSEGGRFDLPIEDREGAIPVEERPGRQDRGEEPRTLEALSARGWIGLHRGFSRPPVRRPIAGMRWATCPLHP